MVLAYILRETIGTAVVVAWLSIVWLVVLSRAALVVAYRRAAADGDANTRSWLVRFRVGAVAAGAAWGAAGVWLFPDHDVLYQMFLIFVLAGVTTGGVVSYSADRFSAIAFSISPVLPLTIRLFAAGDRLSAEMGLAVTLYLGFMLTNLLHITRNVYQGISLRHKAAVSEEKMRASERHLKQAQSIANMGSWKLDFATGKLNWSDELYRIYGVSPETFTPTVEGLLGLLHPDDRPALQARMTGRGAGPKEKPLEYRCVWPDGTIRHCEGQGDVIFDAAGRPESISGTVQDITERKQYEHALNESMRKLEQKEMAKTRFLAAAGHDLRQPLAAANLFIDALKIDRRPMPARTRSSSGWIRPWRRSTGCWRRC